MSDSENLDARLQNLLDGDSGLAERAVLMSEIAENAEARRIYLDYIYLEMSLELAEAEISPESAANVVPMDQVLARQKRRTLRLALVAAAIVILISGISLMLTKISDPPLASFRISPQTEFTLTHATPEGESAPEGNAMAVGSRLKLTRGALELSLGDGVEAIFRAPADFTLRSESVIGLAHGSAWVEVEQEAIGFQVETPDFLVTDLGTEFGVSSKLDAPDEVYVFAGRVRVSEPGKKNGGEFDLVAGEARRLTAGGKWEEIKSERDKFFRTLPESDLLPSHIHWSFDEVDSDGRIETSGTMKEAAGLELRVGTPGEGPLIAEGRVGNAVHFDQSGDSLISNWQGISAGRPRSLAFWLKLPDDVESYDARLLAWGEKSPDGSLSSEWSARATSFEYRDLFGRDKPADTIRLQLHLGASWVIGSTELQLGEWNHVAICFGGNVDSRGRPKVDLYVNGRSDKSLHVYGEKGYGEPLDTLTSPEAPLTIGHSRSFPDVSCNAALDELYIFDSKISPEAVRALANP